MTAAAGTGGRWRPAPFAMLGDERLAQQVSAGDERAFAVVYERYHQILYRYCRSILRDDADAEDALQSTFAAAFAALRAGHRDAPIRPWLFRIAHNESISALRRRRPAFELSQAPERPTSSIEDQVDERAQVSVLVRDLHQLTDRQRSALVLRELSGLSHQEIAIALGTSVGAAKQTIFEARQSLFEFAEGRAMACHEIRRTVSDADGRTLRSRRVRAHLRECQGCAAFAAAIPSRTGELRALAPALPGTAAVGLLGRIAASSAGRGSGAGLARLTAGAVAKTASAGAGLGANALAGVAVVATATAGVTIGMGRIVNGFGHRDSVRVGASAAAVAPARNSIRVPSSLVGLWSAPAALSDAALGRAAGSTPTTASSDVADGVLRTGGEANSGSAVVGERAWAQGSSNRGRAGSASGAPAGTANVSGTAWRGSPARMEWDGSSTAGSSTQAKAANAGSAPAPSTASGRQSGAPAHRGPGKPYRGGSGQPTAPESGTSAQTGPDGSTAQSPISASVNAPVGAAAGTVTNTVGSVTNTVGSVTNSLGNATQAVGSVTSTVAGVLAGTSSSGSSSASALPVVGSLIRLPHRHRVSS